MGSGTPVQLASILAVLAAGWLLALIGLSYSHHRTTSPHDALALRRLEFLRGGIGGVDGVGGIVASVGVGNGIGDRVDAGAGAVGSGVGGVAGRNGSRVADSSSSGVADEHAQAESSARFPSVAREVWTRTGVRDWV